MVFDITLYNFVIRNQFFVVQIANSISHALHTTASVLGHEEPDRTILTILCKKEIGTCELASALGNLFPKGWRMDIKSREPTEYEADIIANRMKTRR